LALSVDAFGELVRNEGRGRTISRWVPSTLFGQAGLSGHFGDRSHAGGSRGLHPESRVLRPSVLDRPTPVAARELVRPMNPLALCAAIFKGIVKFSAVRHQAENLTRVRTRDRLFHYDSISSKIPDDDIHPIAVFNQLSGIAKHHPINAAFLSRTGLAEFADLVHLWHA
jgi:hypothetical protein